MRICENGTYRDMTDSEIAEMEEAQREAQLQESKAEQTAEERIAALESAVARLTADMIERK